MMEEKHEISSKILNYALQIIHLLTGKDYIIVRKCSEHNTDRSSLQEPDGLCKTQSPITISLTNSQTQETNRKRKMMNEKILELINKIADLLTVEDSAEFDEVAVYFSKEDWDSQDEEHNKFYKDVMLENNQILKPLDLAGPEMEVKMEKERESAFVRHPQHPLEKRIPADIKTDLAGPEMVVKMEKETESAFVKHPQHPQEKGIPADIKTVSQSKPSSVESELEVKIEHEELIVGDDQQPGDREITTDISSAMWHQTPGIVAAESSLQTITEQSDTTVEAHSVSTQFNQQDAIIKVNYQWGTGLWIRSADSHGWMNPTTSSQSKTETLLLQNMSHANNSATDKTREERKRLLGKARQQRWRAKQTPEALAKIRLKAAERERLSRKNKLLLKCQREADERRQKLLLESEKETETRKRLESSEIGQVALKVKNRKQRGRAKTFRQSECRLCETVKDREQRPSIEQCTQNRGRRTKETTAQRTGIYNADHGQQNVQENVNGISIPDQLAISSVCEIEVEVDFSD